MHNISALCALLVALALISSPYAMLGGITLACLRSRAFRQDVMQTPISFLCFFTFLTTFVIVESCLIIHFLRILFHGKWT